MNRTLLLLALSISMLGTLQGCSKAPDAAKTGQSSSAKTEKTAATTPDKTAATQTAASSDQSSDQPAGNTQAQSLPASGAKINLQTLSPSMVICTIGSVPLTVGDYQRMFKLQQIQMQNVVTMDAGARQRMLEQGKKLGVSLTPEETSRLLAAARQNKDPNSAEFKKFLQERKVTPQDFDKQVKEIGLAIKTANVMLQQTLLNDLVNRELLIGAAKSAGLAPKAESRYLEIKHSDAFGKLLKATGFTSEQLRDELIKAELTKMMVAKIQQRAQVSDADVKEFYSQHKEMFKHGERIRLSQILVGAPAQDFGNVQSVRTQLQKANPKLTKTELDNQVTAVIQHQSQRAEELMMKAKSGSDFKALANQFTDDVAAKTAKNGGDLGWQAKDQLLPQLAAAVWPLKVGEVYPRLVRSNLGFHIFKVTGHEQAGPVSLNESKANIRAALMNQKADRTLGEWIQDKRMTSKIALSPAFSDLMKKASDNKTSSLPASTN